MANWWRIYFVCISKLESDRRKSYFFLSKFGMKSKMKVSSNSRLNWAFKMIFFPSKIFIKVHMNSHSKREVLEIFNISEENRCYFLISPPVSQLLN